MQHEAKSMMHDVPRLGSGRRKKGIILSACLSVVIFRLKIGCISQSGLKDDASSPSTLKDVRPFRFLLAPLSISFGPPSEAFM